MRVGKIDLEVAQAGEGGRPFLLVHGFTGAKEDFTYWLDPLAQRGWHAVAPDLRGHGGSAHPEKENDYSFAIGNAINSTNEPDLQATPICPEAGVYSVAAGQSGDNKTYKIACTLHGEFEPGVSNQ